MAQEAIQFFPIISASNTAALTSAHTVVVAGDYEIILKFRRDGGGASIILGNNSATNWFVSITSGNAIRYRASVSSNIDSADDVVETNQKYSLRIRQVSNEVTVDLAEINNGEIGAYTTIASASSPSYATNAFDRIGNYNGGLTQFTGPIWDVQVYSGGTSATGTLAFDCPLNNVLTATQSESVSSNDVTLSRGDIQTDWWTADINAFDLILTGGQSNAEGRGSSASSPAVTGMAFSWESSAFSDPADPVGVADTGSAWPAFCNRWLEQTGKIPVIVPIAVGGSALLEAAELTNGNWSTNDTLFDDAITLYEAVLASVFLDSQQVNDVYVTWCQGERDAQEVNGTTVTGALYKQALKELYSRFNEGIVGGIDGFFVFGVGKDNADVYTDEFAEIRQAQLEACEDISKMTMVYNRAQFFEAESKMTDNLHYNQTGLNEMGEQGANTAAALVVSNTLGSDGIIGEKTYNEAFMEWSGQTGTFNERMIKAFGTP